MVIYLCMCLTFDWQGLPRTFCVKHLPKQDTMFDTKYLVEKIGLSGGWRGFSVSHKVFHLVEKSKFKVNDQSFLNCLL